jgi:aromatic-L-amino-acid/L-tryptophan decarboxylase
MLMNVRERYAHKTAVLLEPAREPVPGFSFSETRLRELGYQVMDEVTTYLSGVPARPVWQAMPEDVRMTLHCQLLPEQGQPFEETLAFVRELIMPYPQGNGHPRFAGWINSAPAHAGVLLKPLEAAMNPNCGIGEHAGQELERRTVQWVMDLCGFPIEGSAGVFVSGGSEANFTCLQAARHWAAQRQGWDVRIQGIQGMQRPFVLYQSDQWHFSLRKSVEAMGLGSDSIHIIPSTVDYRMDVAQLARRIREDREAGFQPFCVAATAGTVETGAIDPFVELADLCAREDLWLHVDGAYGAFASLDKRIAPLYQGIERADSLATDQHKWLSVPIDCGCALVRHGTVLHDAFRLTHTEPEEHDPWMSEYTLQRTRRFRALDCWAVVRTAGRAGLAGAIAHNLDLARLFAGLISAESDLELLADGPLSIVRFRYAPPALRDQPLLLNTLNKTLVRKIQEGGRAFFTSTRFQGQEALRACLVNYLTTAGDVQAMIEEILSVARSLN